MTPLSITSVDSDYVTQINTCLIVTCPYCSSISWHNNMLWLWHMAHGHLGSLSMLPSWCLAVRNENGWNWTHEQNSNIWLSPHRGTMWQGRLKAHVLMHECRYISTQSHSFWQTRDHFQESLPGNISAQTPCMTNYRYTACHTTPARDGLQYSGSTPQWYNTRDHPSTVDCAASSNTADHSVSVERIHHQWPSSSIWTLYGPIQMEHEQCNTCRRYKQIFTVDIKTVPRMSNRLQLNSNCARW